MLQIRKSAGESAPCEVARKVTGLSKPKSWDFGLKSWVSNTRPTIYPLLRMSLVIVLYRLLEGSRRSQRARALAMLGPDSPWP